MLPSIPPLFLSKRLLPTLCYENSPFLLLLPCPSSECSLSPCFLTSRSAEWFSGSWFRSSDQNSQAVCLSTTSSLTYQQIHSCDPGTITLWCCLQSEYSHRLWNQMVKHTNISVHVEKEVNYPNIKKQMRHVLVIAFVKSYLRRFATICIFSASIWIIDRNKKTKSKLNNYILRNSVAFPWSADLVPTPSCITM